MNKASIFKQAILLPTLLLTTHLCIANNATVNQVKAGDGTVLRVIVNKGGTGGSLACQQNSGGGSSPATVAFVKACDNELLGKIDSIAPGSPGSPFSVGDYVCGNPAQVCNSTPASAWGVMIYVDPNPKKSGYYGIAMAINDAASGSIILVWGAPGTQSKDIGANQYGTYGGIKNIIPATSQQGNTKTYCDDTADGADCSAAASTSAFNACTQSTDGGFTDWYLPSISELALMYNVAQAGYINSAWTNDYNFQGSLGSYQSYWSSTQYYGQLFDPAADNTGACSSAGTDGSGASGCALGFNFGAGLSNLGGYQSVILKSSVNNAARCARALPI